MMVGFIDIAIKPDMDLAKLVRCRRARPAPNR